MLEQVLIILLTVLKIFIELIVLDFRIWILDTVIQFLPSGTVESAQHLSLLSFVPHMATKFQTWLSMFSCVLWEINTTLDVLRN